MTNDLVRQMVEQSEARFSFLKLETITHETLMATEYEPMRWVIDGLLPEGLTLLVGPPKTGKSWLVLDLCQSVALGQSCLGLAPLETGKVLYLALEDSPRRLQERLLNLALGSTTRNFEMCTEIPRADNGGLMMLRQWIDDNPDCRLIVVDTLQHFREKANRGIETYASDYDALIPIQKLSQEKRVAIVLIHHTRKAKGEDPLDKVSGTTAITGAADCLWLLDREKKTPNGSLMVTGRDVDEQDLALRFDNASYRWQLLGEATNLNSSAEESALLELLAEYGAPVTPAIASRELAISRSAAKMRLSRLYEKRLVEKVKYGHYVLTGQTDSNGTCESHTQSHTPKTIVIPEVTAQGNRVTPLPEIVEPKHCDSVTLCPKAFEDNALGGHTVDVTPVTVSDSVTTPEEYFSGSLNLEGEQ